jgi:predicted nucleic acid-binding protein
VVIYLDSSVALAAVLTELRQPSEALWTERLLSSRLLEYEVWNTIFAKGMGDTHRGEIAAMLRKIDLVELSRDCLQRALRPYPVPVRTLDSLHLATMAHLREQGEEVEFASYDKRLLATAGALGIPIAALCAAR